MIHTNIIKFKDASVYVSLGANLGEKIENRLHGVLKKLSTHPRIQICRISHFYQSVPLQARGPDFINAVAMLRTDIQPFDLLEILKKLEKKYGREWNYKNSPRTLDLDLLLYENLQFQTEELHLPHPRMYERAFVLRPLMDINPELEIPPEGKKVRQLLRTCLDQKIKILENN